MGVSRPSFKNKELHPRLLGELSADNLKLSALLEESWTAEVTPALAWPAYNDWSYSCRKPGPTWPNTKLRNVVPSAEPLTAWPLFSIPQVLTPKGPPITFLKSNLHLWVSYLENPAFQRMWESSVSHLERESETLHNVVGDWFEACIFFF